MTEQIKKCLEYGVNFFDNAEAYGSGACEILMGNSFKELGVKREDVVVTTKIFFNGFPPKQPVINSGGLSRKHIIEGAKASLKRLQMDYVDVIFAHRPDLDTPLEETCRAFSWLIDQGMAFYWGTSEWSASRITEAHEICKRLNLHAPIAEQPEYSMLVRNRFEKEYRPLYERFGYGTTVWGPIAGGILTGKYNEGQIPEDSRMGKVPLLHSMVWPRYFGPGKAETTQKILKGLEALAKELGYTQIQLALAWGLANKDVSTLILGFSRPEQIDENMKALELYKKWNADIEKRCEEMLGNAPEADMDFRNFTQFPSRRSVGVHKPEVQ